MRAFRTIETFLMKRYSRDNLFDYYRVRILYLIKVLTIGILIVLLKSLFFLPAAYYSRFIILGAALLLVFSIWLIYKGLAGVAGHVYLTVVSLAVWLEMFFVPNVTAISKLDTIAYIFALLAFAPLLVAKRFLIIYSTIHLALFGTFIAVTQRAGFVDSHSLTDYSRDTFLALIFIMVFSYLLVDLAERSREGLTNANRDLFEANVKLKQSMEESMATLEELEATNEEMVATLDTLERTLDELGATRDVLEESHTRLRSLMDSMPLPLLSLDRNSPVYANHAFIDFFKLDVSDLQKLESPFTGIITHEATLRSFTETVRQFKEKGETVFSPGVFTLSTARQGERIVEIRCSRIGEECLYIFNDLTELMLSRDAMVQTEKIMTLGGLSAGMAHEINNPLGIITQAIGIIRNRIDPRKDSNSGAAAKAGLSAEGLALYLEDRNIIEYLQAIQDASSRAAAIVRTMLEFSRNRDRSFERAELGSLIDKALSLVLQDFDLESRYDFKRITVKRRCSAETLHALCMTNEIIQVLLNIIRNAAHAMSSDRDDQGEPFIEISTWRDEEMVFISVQDNGPGIRSDVLTRIFEPFFTTKEKGKGTGLGLSVSRYIIEDIHGGSLKVLSEEGRGAQFILGLREA